MTPLDVELARSEAEFARDEADLQMQLDGLLVTRLALSRRLTELRRRAAEAAGAGGDDPELIRRLESVVIPEPSAEACQAPARLRRREAVTARQEAVAHLRHLLRAWAQDDLRLALQLATDEASVRARLEAVALARTAVVPLQPARAARVAQRVPMQAVITLTSEDNFFSGFSSNVSDGGVFVATVNLLPLGTEVALSFCLPTGEAIEAQGVVRWVREVNDAVPEQYPGLGVQFTSLAPETEVAIHRFVQEREPLFFAAA